MSFENVVVGIVAFTLLGLLAFAVLLVLRKRKSVHDNMTIQRRSRILSLAEKSFFECLVNELTDDFYVFTKVAMQDVVDASPKAGFIDRRLIESRLANQRFDYVLCKKRDLSIFGVIELENFEPGVNLRRLAARERLVNDVCKAAQLRLFYFDIRQDYRGVDIRRLVTGRQKSKTVEPIAEPAGRSQMTIDDPEYASFARQKTCPQCNSEVVTKVAVKGKNIGDKFLMCRKYPYCDYRVPLTDKKILDMEKHKDKQSLKQGYKDWSSG